MHSLKQCLPVPLTKEMAKTVPGKVYLLKLAVGAEGKVAVTLRPFGSHGYGI
jgi:hypothetical protein